MAEQPPSLEILDGVKRLCEACYNPIDWGQVTWHQFVGVDPPRWETIGLACLRPPS